MNLIEAATRSAKTTCYYRLLKCPITAEICLITATLREFWLLTIGNSQKLVSSLIAQLSFYAKQGSSATTRVLQQKGSRRVVNFPISKASVKIAIFERQIYCRAVYLSLFSNVFKCYSLNTECDNHWKRIYYRAAVFRLPCDTSSTLKMIPTPMPPETRINTSARPLYQSTVNMMQHCYNQCCVTSFTASSTTDAESPKKMARLYTFAMQLVRTACYMNRGWGKGHLCISTHKVSRPS